MFHPDITIVEVSRAADLLGCYLVPDLHGNVIITPRSQAHGNGTVCKFPRHKQQIMRADLTTDTGPEVL